MVITPCAPVATKLGPHPPSPLSEGGKGGARRGQRPKKAFLRRVGAKFSFLQQDDLQFKFQPQSLNSGWKGQAEGSCSLNPSSQGEWQKVKIFGEGCAMYWGGWWNCGKRHPAPGTPSRKKECHGGWGH